MLDKKHFYNQKIKTFWMRKSHGKDEYVVSFYWVIPVIMSLLILTLFVGTYFLTRQERDIAATINISGRQRMLALEISFLSRSMVLETSSAKRRPLRDRLENAVDIMATAQSALTRKTGMVGSAFETSPSFGKLYFSEDHIISRIVSDYIGRARRLLADWKNVQLNNPDMVYILREGPTTVVRNLDIIVTRYQKNGEESIASILKMERAALLAGFLLFVAEVVYISLPLISRIKRQNKQIIRSADLLKDSKRYADQLLHALNQHSLVSIADIKGNIIYVNSKFCEVSGYAPSELINMNHRILKTDAHSEQFFKDLWGTISTGQTWSGEICNKTSSGDIFWVQSTIVPFLNSTTGKPEQYVSIRTDITLRKQMLDKLDRLFWQAEAANTAKSEFLANMSHELRTPLGHIIGFSEILMMNILEPEVLENVECIKEAGDDLLNKVNSLLEFVNDDNWKRGVPEQIDIVDLVNCEFVDYFRDLARKSKRRFTKTIPDQEIFLRANSLDLLSAFRKIALNAVQFSAEDDIVGVGISAEEDMVTIAVFDTGPGLPPHIFQDRLEPFEIGEPVATKSNSGMGLGLALAKKLCLQNGGVFEIVSDEDIGTKIYFKFPVIPV